MAVKGASVAYMTAGGLILLSGVKGSSIPDTLRAALKGNLSTLSDTQKPGSPSLSVSSGQDDTGGVGTPGSPATGAVSGSENQNLMTVARYLVSNGYSKPAAAGICGCIAGEAPGASPEAMQGGGSGGGGLIQWTPISAHPGYVTGNADKDMQTQLPAIIEYNNAQGAGLVAMLNQISDPVAAARFYSENFERPRVKDSDVRASVAQSVYKQLTSQTVTGASTDIPGVTK